MNFSISVNGQPLGVEPASFEVIINDLDNGETTTRTTDGLLHRDRIAVKRTLNLKFNLLTWEQASKVLQAFKSEFVSVSYPDPELGAARTMECYVGNRPSTAVLKKNGTYYWSDIAFSLIER